MIPDWGAHYRCVSCGWEFIGYAGPQQSKAALLKLPGARSEPTECKACGSPYMRWLNYEQMFPPKRVKPVAAE